MTKIDLWLAAAVIAMIGLLVLFSLALARSEQKEQQERDQLCAAGSYGKRPFAYYRDGHYVCSSRGEEQK